MCKTYHEEGAEEEEVATVSRDFLNHRPLFLGFIAPCWKLVVHYWGQMSEARKEGSARTRLVLKFYNRPTNTPRKDGEEFFKVGGCKGEGWL